VDPVRGDLGLAEGRVPLRRPARRRPAPRPHREPRRAARRRAVPVREPARRVGRRRGRPDRRRGLRRAGLHHPHSGGPRQSRDRVRARRLPRPAGRARRGRLARHVRAETGGRSGMPFPRRVRRTPFFQWASPTVWTTLRLTIGADGIAAHELVGASDFPRHWVYDDAGQLVAKAGRASFQKWQQSDVRDPQPVGQRGLGIAGHRRRERARASALDDDHARRRQAHRPEGAPGRPARPSKASSATSSTCSSTGSSACSSTRSRSASSARAR
jgi:hypothetical protein